MVVRNVVMAIVIVSSCGVKVVRITVALTVIILVEIMSEIMYVGQTAERNTPQTHVPWFYSSSDDSHIRSSISGSIWSRSSIVVELIVHLIIKKYCKDILSQQSLQQFWILAYACQQLIFRIQVNSDFRRPPFFFYLPILICFVNNFSWLYWH